MGAVAIIRQNANVTVPPFYRARNEKALAAVQSHLGEAAFQLAWRAGQLMGMEEAMTTAMNMTFSLEQAVAKTLSVMGSDIQCDTPAGKLQRI